MNQSGTSAAVARSNGHKTMHHYSLIFPPSPRRMKSIWFFSVQLLRLLLLHLGFESVLVIVTSFEIRRLNWKWGYLSQRFLDCRLLVRRTSLQSGRLLPCPSSQVCFDFQWQWVGVAPASSYSRTSVQAYRLSN